MSLQAAQLRKRARNLPPLITNVIPPNNTITNNPIQIITITFNKNIQPGTNYNNITVKNSLGIAQTITKTINNNKITITPNTPLNNLLTPNQQTGTETLGNTNGFIASGATINSSTEQPHTGTRSLKVTTNNNTGNEGFRTTTTTVKDATSYTAGFWVYAPTGTLMRASIYSGTLTTIYWTATGTWEYKTITKTSIGTSMDIRIATNTQSATTFYTDDLSLTKNVDDYSILIPTNSITDLAGNPLQDPLNSTFTVNTV